MRKRRPRKKLSEAALSRSQSNRGKDLEDAIDLMHYSYLSQRRAYPVKNHPEIRIQSRSGGKVTGYLKNNGAPDYSVISAGWFLIFDAKRSAARDFPLGNIEQHQADGLSAALAQRAFAFLFIQTPGGRFVVPWSAIVGKYTRWRDKAYKRGTGATTISADELIEWSIVRFGRRDAPDYLALVVDHLERNKTAPLRARV